MNPAQSPPPSIAIIGTGFGGLGLAIRLKQAGIDSFALFEKAADVGGCWRDNTYPGAACDVPSNLYSFSFAPNPQWTRMFAPQAEILDYLRHCVERYGLRRHIRFNTEIAGADFDEERGLWRIRTAGGELHEAQVLVSACGQLNRPAYPKLQGLERFAGTQFHSARWDHGYDLAGKRVAVLGTGASAIQFVPQIAPQVRELLLFQRSAPYVLPKPDRAYAPWQRALFRRLPALQKLSRGVIYSQHEARAFGFTVARQAMKLFELSFRRHLRREIADPVLRAKLTPDYPMGCKRILMSNDYYAAMARPNVKVIDDAIAEVLPQGIRTRDGVCHDVDAIIYGTGFAATDFLAPMSIRGRGGIELNQAWRDGAEAYLGISVSGFPNLFVLYGPNTNLGHNSIVYMLESQIAYVMQGVQALQARRRRWLEVRPQVQQAFNARIQQRIHHTVWDQGCSSWYQTASGKNTNNWPGFTLEYRLRTRQLDLADYEPCPAA